MSKESYQKNEKDVIAHGKTKIIYRDQNHRNIGYFESKDDITKDDDPSKTQTLPGKGIWSNTTTCRVFELLRDCGLPVAFIEQSGEREFIADLCEMLKMEVVVRRNRVGSYLNRFPNLTPQSKDQPPSRSHQLIFELFLKTTQGKVENRFNELIGTLPIDPKKNLPLDDPLIDNPKDDHWELYWPKKPRWDKDAKLDISLNRNEIIPHWVTVEKIKELSCKCFLILESAWAQIGGYRPLDFKIEFGITRDGRLVITDVIDNDSWRLRDASWQELSKQLFRDDEKMELIAHRYQQVAELTSRFRIPSQALVIWRGSEKDPLLTIPKVPGINFIDIIASGHKETFEALIKLEDVINQFPEGGAIIAEVGMSNGLGAILAAHTSWPVISYAISSKSFPEDIWSSVRMPSYVPSLTVMGEENAILGALNVLSQKNPAAYAYRQHAIEALDKY